MGASISEGPQFFKGGPVALVVLLRICAYLNLALFSFVLPLGMLAQILFGSSY